MFADVSAFLITIFAGWLSHRRSPANHTFGYHRAEVLGSLVSVLLIWLVTGILLVEAVQRIINPEPRVDGRLKFILAMVGICVNLVCLFALGAHGGHVHESGHEHGGHHGCSHGHSAPSSSPVCTAASHRSKDPVCQPTALTRISGDHKEPHHDHSDCNNDNHKRRLQSWS
ncbi:hypothetical protein CEUSTIGMA_g11544.t1 [Chlamydomonas eustigma]|uniref:Cation efflux protein transmembrane domain-containing protein n=1 Tax=Chlamydomonas eustigma TaxID=1157962 RepID=A0A250XM04_9CHLO|nr:hypothetical protein CEUSTIGMA_g11544.t1 [Chlamydomonas eustigma]|eukprot:GAX84121.1 hypothetical protein CEUSTIGMA_g11544.t1 [Chlamydomonas eustigma]